MTRNQDKAQTNHPSDQHAETIMNQRIQRAGADSEAYHRQRRETIMDQRLRAARHTEEADEELLEDLMTDSAWLPTDAEVEFPSEPAHGRANQRSADNEPAEPVRRTHPRPPYDDGDYADDAPAKPVRRPHLLPEDDDREYVDDEPVEPVRQKRPRPHYAADDAFAAEDAPVRSPRSRQRSPHDDAAFAAETGQPARPRRRPGTIMDQRLRSAGYIEPDEEDDEAYYTPPRRPRRTVPSSVQGGSTRHHMPIPDPSYDYAYRIPAGAPRPMPRSNPSSGQFGCLQAFMAVMLVILIGLIVLLFSAGGVAQHIAGWIPNVGEQEMDIRATGPAILSQIQQLNRLETTSYTMEQVFEASVDSKFFPNPLTSDRILLVASADTVAGIDLSKLTQSDVIIAPDGSTVTIYLPPVEILSTYLNNDRTRVFDRDQGWLAGTNPEMETWVRQIAEERLLNAACENGILERAAQDSQQAVEQFLRLAGYEQIVVIAAPVPSCTTVDTELIPPEPGQ
ncbi:MAG: DUF4230 domain-containing protein [Chloroflexaceae bacterium]|nr:DUF4230 domain-containing protein [Chloroflexaceae bacterium]